MKKNWLYMMSRGRPPVFYYVVVIINVMIGIFFTTGFLMGDVQSVVYASVTLMDKNAWGAALLIASGTNLYGLISRNMSMIKTSSLVAAMLWFFAGVSLLLSGHIYVFITVALLHTLFHFHLFVASILGAVYRL